jgi:macrolide-specific efflux system membrane fusion protein
MTNDEIRMTNEKIKKESSPANAKATPLSIFDGEGGGKLLCQRGVRWRFSILGLFVICNLVLGISLQGCSAKSEKPLETAKVARGNISAELPASGIVIPRNRLEIKPPVAGRVEDVLVQEGQQITKGQILAWMSSSDRAALLDAARAKGPDEMKYWQDVYKPAPIIAPLDGFVIKRNMEPGQFFGVSEVVLVMADRLIVQAQIDETDISRIKLGQAAAIQLDSFPDHSIPGAVEQIAYESVTINNVNVYNVNVLPKNVPSFFRSGMSATINFMMEQRTDVPYLPISAIKKKGGRTYCFVKKDEKIIPIQIQTGLENNDKIEIISGISLGDDVVIPNNKIAQELLDTNRFRQPFNFLGRKK